MTIISFVRLYSVNINYMRTRTHIRHKGRFQNAGLQPLEVDVLKERVGFDSSTFIRLAAEPLLGIFG